MHLLAGTGLALILAISLCFVMKGAGGLLRKQRRSAAMVLLGIAMLPVYVVALGILAYLLGPAEVNGTALDPSYKARALVISELMHISAWGVPAGLLVGAATAVRDWRLRPPDAFLVRTANAGRERETSVTNWTAAVSSVSRRMVLVLGCLVGIDLLTKVIALRSLRSDIELNPSASLQFVLRINESGMGTWARAVSGGSSPAQRAGGGVFWFMFTMYLVAIRRTGWALRLKVLVGCAAFAAALACMLLARSAFASVPGPIVVAIARMGPAAFMTYLWSIAPPGLWQTTATLLLAAALGNLLGLFVYPGGVVDFVYSRFLAAALRQGVANIADLYYDAGLVCLVVAGVRAIAIRLRQMRVV
jgi:lipoprotein signal peptidase